MKKLRLFPLLLSAALWVGGASTATAQNERGRVEQIHPSIETRSGPVQQIGDGSPTPQATQPPVQISSGNEAAKAQPQLTREGPAVRAPVQLYQGDRTAQASEPLSRPSEGRRGAIAAIEGGEDRCDPADANQSPAEVCRHVIETRAAEFRRPDPTRLSPEQRLLIQQQLREGTTSESATRRLASEGDADSLEGLAVASIVLGNSPSAEDEIPADPTQDAATDAAAALVTAIITQTGSTAPPEQ